MASSGNQHCANCIGTLSFPLYYRTVSSLVVLETAVSVSKPFETEILRSWSWSWHLRSCLGLGLEALVSAVFETDR